LLILLHSSASNSLRLEHHRQRITFFNAKFYNRFPNSTADVNVLQLCLTLNRKYPSGNKNEEERSQSKPMWKWRYHEEIYFRRKHEKEKSRWEYVC